MKKCLKIEQLDKELMALQDTIYVIGGKWKLPIIHSLCNGNMRFRDIERSIPGISTRMLARNLKELEDNKLITRSQDPDFPSIVEYKFTEYATEYGILINEMIKWGVKHRAIVTSK